MRIVELIREDLILPQLGANKRLDVIRELGACFARHHEGVSEANAVRVLAERERLGSTAVADGLAIPHAKLSSIRDPIACFGRSQRGIDFGAPDGGLTHFFFALIAPESEPSEHLKALARISRLFRNADFRARLMAARTAQDIYEMIAAEETD